MGTDTTAGMYRRLMGEVRYRVLSHGIGDAATAAEPARATSPA